MNDELPRVFVALPAMNEMENMKSFMDCINSQDYPRIELYVCVNQKDEWWESTDRVHICENNLETIQYLQSLNKNNLHIIDRCSKGKGWKGKKFGVGQARKVVMDQIALNATDIDIIVCIDADTYFNPGYFSSIVHSFRNQPKAVALSVPYYHPLNDDVEANRQILHYEIYMRYYALNLWRINSPYSFTAIGSAMTLPVWSYKAIGGITPHKSGEDFYFLQKLRKFGKVLIWNSEKVYPAARFSDRVFFGTGPAMIKGRQGDWSSYPIYPFQLFDKLASFFNLFPQLYENEIETPLDEFLLEKFGNKDIWNRLRENSKTEEQFVRACFQKFDALRTLQYLKWEYSKNIQNDETNLLKYLNKFYADIESVFHFDISKLDFNCSSISELDKIRNFLVQIEQEIQMHSENTLN